MTEKVDQSVDNALLGILQNAGNIKAFLDIIFSFLMRRTDFYYICTKESPKLGFPPKYSEQLVYNAYKQREIEFKERLEKDVKSKQEKIETPVEKPKETTKKETVEKVEKTPNNADFYNGAKRDGYAWSQTIQDCSLKIDIPSGLNAKNLDVVITKKSICVKNRTDQSVILDRKLVWDIKNDNYWSFDPKESQLLIDMDKCEERWWECVFEGEEKINTQKIDCSRPMEELDEEGQAKIDKLMYDQHQIRNGLPTSEQQKVNDMLKKGWDKPGSPFVNQPFDPSIINKFDDTDSEDSGKE